MSRPAALGPGGAGPLLPAFPGHGPPERGSVSPLLRSAGAEGARYDPKLGLRQGELLIMLDMIPRAQQFHTMPEDRRGRKTEV